MDVINNKKSDADKSGLDFVVMPKFEGTKPATPPADGPANLVSRPAPQRGKKTIAIIAGIFTIAVLAAAGYYIYMRIQANLPNVQPKLSIDDPATLARADTDDDGLSNEREDIAGTDFQKADSDGDGIADGDEVDIFGSDPMLFDTDSDSYDDGQEVARGYSPVLNSTDRADSAERQKWLQKSVDLGLHEPTITTLRTKADAAAASNKTLYVNKAYDYSVEYPQELVLREENNGQTVGLYIAGSAPDEEITADPFVITLAGQAEAQNLKDWVTAVYERYQAVEELNINGASAVRLRSMTADEYGCSNDGIFFRKGNSVIAITWNCSDSAALDQYYTGIVNSFKFR